MGSARFKVPDVKPGGRYIVVCKYLLLRFNHIQFSTNVAPVFGDSGNRSQPFTIQRPQA